MCQYACSQVICHQVCFVSAELICLDGVLLLLLLLVWHEVSISMQLLEKEVSNVDKTLLDSLGHCVPEEL